MAHRNFPESLSRMLKNLPNHLSTKSWNGKISTWMAKYEDFVGLTEVKAAQNRVLESEKRFVKSQEDRRDIQRQITAVQQKLHELHVELDRIPRGDDKYLALVTHEHSVIKEERRLKEVFQHFEKEERENFSILSHTVRDSHEKERAQAEKTKYWSIIGSVLGTVLGVVGTTINNRMRMRELRDLVESATKSNIVFNNVEELSREVSSAIQQQLTTLSSDEKMQSLTEARWKELQDSILTVIHECDNQQNAISELSQRLEASLIPGMEENPTDVQSNSYFLVHHTLKTLLDQQTQHNNRLVALTCILVPTCTWALCKFFNL